MSDHHAELTRQNEARLWWVLGLTCLLLIAETVGGLLTHSLALLSDAAHVSTDVAAIGIAIMALRVGKRMADEQRTFGYYRFEILAVVLNALLLFAVAIYIVSAAYMRLQHPPELESLGMLLVAMLGLVVNVICMKIMIAGRHDSLNMKAAYLEALSDMVGSGGVIVAAVVIHMTGWWWVDALVAVGIGVWMLPRMWVLFRSSVHILLEGVPERLNVRDIRTALSQIDGVESIHDLHIWSLTMDKVSLTVHLVCPARAQQEVLEDAMDLLARRFAIYHVAIQCEEHPCAMSRPEIEHYKDSEISVYEYSHVQKDIKPPSFSAK